MSEPVCGWKFLSPETSKLTTIRRQSRQSELDHTCLGHDTPNPRCSSYHTPLYTVCIKALPFYHENESLEAPSHDCIFIAFAQNHHNMALPPNQAAYNSMVVESLVNGVWYHVISQVFTFPSKYRTSGGILHRTGNLCIRSQKRGYTLRVPISQDPTVGLSERYYAGFHTMDAILILLLI